MPADNIAVIVLLELHIGYLYGITTLEPDEENIMAAFFNMGYLSPREKTT